MKWVLNIAYVILLTLLSPLILWRSVRYGRYRRGWREKLLGRLPVMHDDRPRVWFHAVSVGEVLQLQKIVESFRSATNDACAILVTTSTDTGYELARERFADCTVSWFPLDFSWAVRTAVSRVRPTLVVLVELELWPNFLQACHDGHVKTALINARMSDRSFRGYSRLRRLVRPLLERFSLVVAQTDEYAQRLQRLGAVADVVHMTGSVKFDGVLTDRDNAGTQQLRSLFRIADSDIVFIAGSTQHPEEQLAMKAWQNLRAEQPRLRLILVPRHRERFEEVATVVTSAGCPLQRRSALRAGDQVSRDAVILLDTIGELAACWGLADIAFVGGSFGSRGGQNMLEPAAYGAAVMFGPNTWNFREIVGQLRNARAAVQLNSTEELAPQLNTMVVDSMRRQQLGTAARQLVQQQQGALQRTTDLLVIALSDKSPSAEHQRSVA